MEYRRNGRGRVGRFDSRGQQLGVRANPGRDRCPMYSDSAIVVQGRKASPSEQIEETCRRADHRNDVSADQVKSDAKPDLIVGAPFRQPTVRDAIQPMASSAAVEGSGTLATRKPKKPL